MVIPRNEVGRSIAKVEHGVCQGIQILFLQKITTSVARCLSSKSHGGVFLAITTLLGAQLISLNPIGKAIATIADPDPHLFAVKI
jgi:hypothetical protein